MTVDAEKHTYYCKLNKWTTIDSKTNMQQGLPQQYEFAPSEDTDGFVSARLVAVATADKFDARHRRCEVLEKPAACLPGAEHSSAWFLLKTGKDGAQGKI